MRATLMYGAGDVRVEKVPDPVIHEPTDAIVRVLRSCICGSDLWPYRSMPPSEHGRRMGHEFLGIIEDTGTVVTGLKRGDLVIAPFVWSDGTCDFCRQGLLTSCWHGGLWAATLTAARARQFACRRRPARWSSSRPGWTRRCCRRC
jgi:threonine dehydrogenase-like Zn-dependent dehydrogenase